MRVVEREQTPVKLAIKNNRQSVGSILKDESDELKHIRHKSEITQHN